MKTLSTLAFLLGALAVNPALASNHGSDHPASKQGKGNSQKSASDEQVVDISNMHATPYDCDLGDKLTIYKNPGDDQEIAVHWRKRTHKMTRMPTSTGAERYEDRQNGLVWIGIPAKGMLLDSKKGRQLANECRNDVQKRMFVQK